MKIAPINIGSKSKEAVLALIKKDPYKAALDDELLLENTAWARFPSLQKGNDTIRLGNLILEKLVHWVLSPD